MPFWIPPQSQANELLDASDLTKAELIGTFRDLAFINRWFGGWDLVDKSLRPYLPTSGKVRLLDIASGAADVPLALAKRWRKLGIELEITVVDLNPMIVELAEEAAHKQGFTNIKTIVADVFEYDWSQVEPYDFVTCSLAFHHFTPQQCSRMLSLMSDLSQRAFVVNDLRRSWLGWIGAKLLTRTLVRDPMVQNDGPLSILRSFTPTELWQLAQLANYPADTQIVLKQSWFSRQVLIGFHKG